MQYKTGTVSVTNGSATVTGSGTLWAANVNPGDGFTVAGTGVPYTVASVTNDTSLTLSAAYSGATDSGKSYAVWRDFTTNESLPELSQGDIETATVWTRALRKIDGLIGAATTTSRGTVEKATTGEAEAGTADKYPDAAGTHSAIRELAVGTVSQSAGVPTGAVIERGSNSNGEYVKFADGTLMCTKLIVISETVVTFSHAFLDTSYVAIASPDRGTAGGSNDNISTIFNTGINNTASTRQARSVRLNDGATIQASFNYIIALGRWY